MDNQEQNNQNNRNNKNGQMIIQCPYVSDD